jgi:hypothetical protein
MHSLLAVNNRLTYSYDFDIVERNGVRHHVTKNHKAVVEPTVGVYHLTNLFNGDKLLGKVLQHNPATSCGLPAQFNTVIRGVLCAPLVPSIVGIAPAL